MNFDGKWKFTIREIQTIVEFISLSLLHHHDTCLFAKAKRISLSHKSVVSISLRWYNLKYKNKHTIRKYMQNTITGNITQ